MVDGLGLLKASIVLLPEQIIFDDEIYHTSRVMAGGIGTSPEQLALDIIESVGPGCHFLKQKHTRRTIRDIWLPKLTHPDPWMGNLTSMDIRARAKATFQKILTEHQPEPLPKDIQDELKVILKESVGI